MCFLGESKYLYRLHIKEDHEGNDPNKGTIQCDICDKIFKSRTKLKEHFEYHHTDIIYNCEKCDYKSKFNRRLQFHINKVHNNVKYKCDSCDFQACMLATVKNHKRSVHDSIKLKCPSCEFETLSRSSLQFQGKNPPR